MGKKGEGDFGVIKKRASYGGAHCDMPKAMRGGWRLRLEMMDLDSFKPIVKADDCLPLSFRMCRASSNRSQAAQGKECHMDRLSDNAT